MTLDEWVRSVAAELGIDDLDLDTDRMHILLDLARDAAHAVQRPAAPLTTFLVGVAVGRGQSLGAAAARATALAMPDVDTADGATTGDTGGETGPGDPSGGRASSQDVP